MCLVKAAVSMATKWLCKSVISLHICPAKGTKKKKKKATGLIRSDEVWGDETSTAMINTRFLSFLQWL